LQLEKLLSKNYYLYQSAKEGFRSYLLSYASYSLKKIFDVKKLDLVKVGKAFGFAVPPRVNVNMGEQSNSGKRKRGSLGAETESESEPDDQNDAPVRGTVRHSGRDKGKEKRKEQLGRKRVEKEIYRKEKIRRVDDEGNQWTR
jgi:ATP-dependent RNA helicase DDX18/HAS1